MKKPIDKDYRNCENGTMAYCFALEKYVEHLESLTNKESEEQPNQKCDGCKRVEGLEGEHIYTCNCGVEQPKEQGVEEFLKSKHIDNRILNREDLPEYHIRLSNLLTEYAKYNKGSVSELDIDEYFENHPRLNPTYNELKWIKLGYNLSNKQVKE